MPWEDSGEALSRESPLARREAPYLYQTVSGKLVPSPVTGEKFYRDWYELLNRQGISFVKVDGQSSATWYFENDLPLAQAVRGMNEVWRAALPAWTEGSLTVWEWRWEKYPGKAGNCRFQKQRRLCAGKRRRICGTSSPERIQCPVS